jgi:hypothetical protein
MLHSSKSCGVYNAPTHLSQTDLDVGLVEPTSVFGSVVHALSNFQDKAQDKQ